MKVTCGKKNGHLFPNNSYFCYIVAANQSNNKARHSINQIKLKLCLMLNIPPELKDCK